MHLKAYAVDGKLLRTGSGNFSRPGLAEQDNDLVLISDPAAVDRLRADVRGHLVARAKHRRARHA